MDISLVFHGLSPVGLLKSIIMIEKMHKCGKLWPKSVNFKIAFLPSTGQIKDMAKTPKKAKRTPNAAFMKL